jgi:hypothetical protein
MSDTIKTTIEFGGIVMKCNGRGTIAVEHLRNALIVYNSDYQISSFTYFPFDLPFYIECKEDPSKLHKFCEMKYHGLVDNPNYDISVDRLREMVKKFDGCLVVFADDAAVLITKTKAIRLGCAKVTGDILNHVLVRFDDRRVSDYVGFYKINATSIPDKWIYRRDFDDEVAAMCKQLKEIEP